jgi:hypothetical protein
VNGQHNFCSFFELMNLGFNSKVQVGEGLYHVQTEDRGLSHPFIDTIVLLQGQILHRRSTSYQDLLAAGQADQVALRVRVEQQHRDILEGLRAGSLPLEPVGAPIEAAPALKIRLRNAGSWLAAGQATLDIEVCDRKEGQPLAGASVEVIIEGANEPTAATGATDATGCVMLRFPMPHLVHPDAAVLVIKAQLETMQDQLRYHLKPKVHDPETPLK